MILIEFPKIKKKLTSELSKKKLALSFVAITHDKLIRNFLERKYRLEEKIFAGNDASYIIFLFSEINLEK
jgi:hypothetical protein